MDLFMMLSRPSETNRRVKRSSTIFRRSRKIVWSKIGRDQLQTGLPQVEGVKNRGWGGQDRAKEGYRRGHLGAKNRNRQFVKIVTYIPIKILKTVKNVSK